MNKIITELELVSVIRECKSAVLLEPPYKRKYPPLGLMKISSALKDDGASVVYLREAKHADADVFFLSTLFTYDFDLVCDTISQIRFFNPISRIIIGGVSATVNKKQYIEHGIADVFCGYSDYLDSYAPDYSIDWKDEEWSKFSYCLSTRGCPGNCGYCFMRRIENTLHVMDWKKAISQDRKYIMMYDANICAFGIDHVREVADFAIKNNKRIFFDSAFDCKFIDRQMADQIARIPLHKNGIRMSFDRIEEDGIFQKAIRCLVDAGIKPNRILAYAIYNYKDNPQEAYYRAKEIQKTGCQANPTCYQPINMMRRSEKHVSKLWTKKLITTYQRYWWMANFRNRMTFDEFIKSDHVTGITQDDMDKWEAK